jgi:hypothetical protein
MVFLIDHDTVNYVETNKQYQFMVLANLAYQS